MRVSDRNDKEIIIKDSSDLRAAIDELLIKKNIQGDALKKSFTEVKEGLSPVSLVKSAFSKITENRSVLNLGLKVAGTVAAGLVAKNVFSKNDKKVEILEDENDVKYVEMEQQKTPILTKLALALATNYLITKIPVITAYTSAIVNQFKNNEEDDADEEKEDDIA